jgi:hypothetical protein
MNDKFSIIIPTMWLSDLIHRMLLIYDRSEFVGEIIIIDNDTTKTPILSQYNKIRRYTKGENIFVNPAWNWGVSLAKFRIILANDDILNSDFDIVGACLALDDKGKRIEDISDHLKFPGLSFGCFMYIKDYEPVPENIKLWYGDDLQYNVSNKKGRLRNFNFSTSPSTTIKSNISYFKNIVIANDIKLADELLRNGTKYKRQSKP